MRSEPDLHFHVRAKLPRQISFRFSSRSTERCSDSEPTAVPIENRRRAKKGCCRTGWSDTTRLVHAAYYIRRVPIETACVVQNVDRSWAGQKTWSTRSPRCSAFVCFIVNSRPHTSPERMQPSLTSNESQSMHRPSSAHFCSRIGRVAWLSTKLPMYVVIGAVLSTKDREQKDKEQKSPLRS